ncbi:MAG: hypothetical protein KDA17_07075 [Candidatus Saccharibacteria bacterium]|nr:hypothetical protein [Candidatus Saccharibacteria bacterium]
MSTATNLTKQVSVTERLLTLQFDLHLAKNRNPHNPHLLLSALVVDVMAIADSPRYLLLEQVYHELSEDDSLEPLALAVFELLSELTPPISVISIEEMPFRPTAAGLAALQAGAK